MASIEILAHGARATSGISDAFDLGTPMVISVSLLSLHPSVPPQQRARPKQFFVELEHSFDGVNWRPLYEFREHDRLPTHEALLDNLYRSLMVGHFRAFALACARYVRAKWTIVPSVTPVTDQSLADQHDTLEFGISGESGDPVP